MHTSSGRRVYLGRQELLRDWNLISNSRIKLGPPPKNRLIRKKMIQNFKLLHAYLLPRRFGEVFDVGNIDVNMDANINIHVKIQRCTQTYTHKKIYLYIYVRTCDRATLCVLAACRTELFKNGRSRRCAGTGRSY